MKNNYIPTIMMVFLPLLMRAQTSNIKGLVKDAQGNYLDGATLQLNAGSKMLKVALSDNGLFEFKDLPMGNYELIAGMIGRETLRRSFTMPKDTIQLILRASVKQLKEVVVSGKKPLVERKADKLIFNVENSIIASGGTIWEALDKAPGVQTSNNGDVKTNGKGVVIYMDDKPLHLSGEDLSNYLKSLPADQLAKIEVITNPPARYDAQGGAILNIVSKKVKAAGFNANLLASYKQAHYGSYSLGTNFNYRSSKLNIYGTYSNTNNKKQHDETEYIIFSSPGKYAYWDNDKLGIRKNSSNSYKIGADYNLTDNQVLGVLINGYNGNSERSTGILTNIYNDHRPTTDSLLNTDNRTNGKTDRYSFNINYKIKMDTLGQSLNIDMDYVPYRNKGNQQVNNRSFLQDGHTISNLYNINTISDQKIDIWSAKVDYAYSFNKIWNMETGLKYNSIKTNNQFMFYNGGQSPFNLDKSRSDEFAYTENTSAAYLSLNATLGKLNVEAGLRGEYTRTKGYSIATDATHLNNYFRLFPSLFVSYTLAKDHDLNMNYGYRIDRPDFWRLNPFKYYTSPYTYLEGNPALQPAFIHNAELGYTFKQRYNISAFFHRSIGYFSNITVQDNVNKIFYDTQRNLDSSEEMGISISLPITPFSWWEINNGLQGSYKKEKSGYLQGQYDYYTYMFYVNTNHVFTIDKKEGLSAEFSGWFASGGIQGIYKLARTYDVSIGLRKTIMKGNGALRLAITDVFNGNGYRIDVNYLDQRNGFHEMNDTRSIALSFSYKLGKKKLAEVRKRSTSSEEERKRTGG